MEKTLFKNFEKALIILAPFLIIWISSLTDRSFCIFKLLFKHECIGCGMTRAVISLLGGNLSEAIEYNPLVLVVFPILLYVWIKAVYNIIVKKF